MRFSTSKTPILDSLHDYYKDKSINPYKMKLSPSTNLKLPKNYQEMEKLLLSEKPFTEENPLNETLNKKMKNKNKFNSGFKSISSIDSNSSFKYDNNPFHTIPKFSFLNPAEIPKLNTKEKSKIYHKDYQPKYYENKKDEILEKAKSRYRAKKENKLMGEHDKQDTIDIVDPFKEQQQKIAKEINSKGINKILKGSKIPKKK
jgi:hypothetical protein